MFEKACFHFNICVKINAQSVLIMEFLNNIQWTRGQPINQIERNLIIQLHGSGLYNGAIARAISRDPRTVKRWLNRFLQTSLVNAKKPSVRQKMTTQAKIRPM